MDVWVVICEDEGERKSVRLAEDWEWLHPRVEDVGCRSDGGDIVGVHD